MIAILGRKASIRRRCGEGRDSRSPLDAALEADVRTLPAAASPAQPAAELETSSTARKFGVRVALVIVVARYCCEQFCPFCPPFRLTTTQMSGKLLPMLEPLTKPQAQVLDAVRALLDRGEPGPTYRELCAEFGWASTGTARDHLRVLARKGYIDLPGGRARHVRIREARAGVAHLPLVGQVVAGAPVVAEESIERMVPVPAEWADHGVHFALRVSGDSMRDAGIIEGDVVVVRKQETASDGEIVVATVDGETTLKRFRRRGDRVVLEAENPRYRSIKIRQDSAVIQGIVVGLLRTYRTRSSA